MKLFSHCTTTKKNHLHQKKRRQRKNAERGKKIPLNDFFMFFSTKTCQKHTAEKWEGKLLLFSCIFSKEQTNIEEENFSVCTFSMKNKQIIIKVKIFLISFFLFFSFNLGAIFVCDLFEWIKKNLQIKNYLNFLCWLNLKLRVWIYFIWNKQKF